MTTKALLTLAVLLIGGGVWLSSCSQHSKTGERQSQEQPAAKMGPQMMQQMMGGQRGMMGGGMMKNMREMMQAMMSGVVPPPGIKPEDLPDPNSEGAKLTVKYCTQCHNLPSPLMHAADEWPGIAGRMFHRMAMMVEMGGKGMTGMMGMMNMKAPSTKEQDVMLAYLKKHSLMSIQPDAIPSPRTEGALLFAATCARCHVLPDPKQHTAQEWPQVVARMRKNMATMRKTVPDAATFRTITAFLQDAARAKP